MSICTNKSCRKSKQRFHQVIIKLFPELETNELKDCIRNFLTVRKKFSDWILSQTVFCLGLNLSRISSVLFFLAVSNLLMFFITKRSRHTAIISVILFVHTPTWKFILFLVQVTVILFNRVFSLLKISSISAAVSPSFVEIEFKLAS